MTTRCKVEPLFLYCLTLHKSDSWHGINYTCIIYSQVYRLLPPPSEAGGRGACTHVGHNVQGYGGGRDQARLRPHRGGWLWLRRAGRGRGSRRQESRLGQRSTRTTRGTRHTQVKERQSEKTLIRRGDLEGIKRLSFQSAGFFESGAASTTRSREREEEEPLID